MEIVTISDTNIFIDLIGIGLLDTFFSLPWEFHTTDMIIHELKEPVQRRKVVAYQHKNVLRVKKFDGKELSNLIAFHAKMCNKTNVSIQDCSVWLYAQDNRYMLLTGDSKLKNAATRSGVDVHGILFVFDKLVENQLLTKEQATTKLKDLILLNPRLPQTDVLKRLQYWARNEKDDG